MPKLVCNQFRTDSFHNGNTEEWDRHVVYLDELEDMYGFDKGVKDLFYELLQRGYCYSANEERIRIVQDVLIEEGYEIDEIV